MDGFYAAVRPFIRPAIGYRYRRAERIEGPAIIMGNHNMDIDAGLLGLSYAQCMRVVASEHVFRKGIITFLIRLFFDPIVRMKGKTEIRTVREMLGVVKKGGRVCIFPEGNRSFNGLTGEITQASATLVKMAKCQLITYRIEGGYLRFPRWARKARRGPTRGREVGRYPAEQLQQMSVDEIHELIKRDLHEDAYARQLENPLPYTGEDLAESIETALYLCPKCGGIGTIQSKGDRFSCPCGLSMRYTEFGMLESTADEARALYHRDRLGPVAAEHDGGAGRPGGGRHYGRRNDFALPDYAVRARRAGRNRRALHRQNRADVRFRTLSFGGDLRPCHRRHQHACV